MYVFFFQAEDGIRDRSPSRGLGDVYKRQDKTRPTSHTIRSGPERNSASVNVPAPSSPRMPVVRKATIAATSNGCRTGGHSGGFALRVMGAPFWSGRGRWSHAPLILFC